MKLYHIILSLLLVSFIIFMVYQHKPKLETKPISVHSSNIIVSANGFEKLKLLKQKCISNATRILDSDNRSMLKYFQSKPKIMPLDTPINNDGKIFVSVASYRDSQCPLTVKNMIEKAHNPEKLVITICEQNEKDDIPCLDNDYVKGVTIKRVKMPASEAMGPCWARYIIQNMWKGEEYYLQIDSHTRFVEGWDTKCKEQLELAKEQHNNDVCLSNYVSTYDLKTEEIVKNPMRGPMSVESIEDDGFFRYNSKYCKPFADGLPKESKGWSGCFSFSKSKIILDAPYDPYTPFLFFGEETDIFVRLFSRGWKIFVPAEPICFTVFDRSYRKTFWERRDQRSTSDLSKLRLYIRFGLLPSYLNDGVPLEIKENMNRYSLCDSEKNCNTFEQFVLYCFQ
jgi:[Skp1-protein]-hydroxyproline N-acetylglucosaminyltransferase